MEIVCTGLLPDLAPFAGVILTSANAARCDVGAVERQLFEDSPLIFDDDFETGDASAWSNEVP